MEIDQTHARLIAKEMSLQVRQVVATLHLISEGATIPFMARYRKEATGGLDELQLAEIRDTATRLEQLDTRRKAILKSLGERELLTKELEEAIIAADNINRLEDIYLPYKPKRRTRATIAKEKGLTPLAELIWEQKSYVEPQIEAMSYINKEVEVNNEEDALKGARDIMAEWINEEADVRASMRRLFVNKASIVSKVMKGKEEEGQKYKDYFDWSEPIAKIPSHRLLAMRRGEKELILSLSIRPETEDAVELLSRSFIKGNNESSNQVQLAIEDSYKRLMAPSMETEIRLLSKEKADEEAIHVFVDNLRQLLLAAPLGRKRVMAIDPGFRTGCKVVCLDHQGQLLEYTAIFPHPPQQRKAQSELVLTELAQKHKIEVIAVGNGTASRETEQFLRSIELPKETLIVMVSENGASVYSASEVAREEFPDHDVTVRGAVSIGRRLMDPLAELVKIDPKSIGVGQYQHDVDQNALKKSLDDTVMSCVNAVGVEVNTASKQLLTYVSGLGPTLAENIVKYRSEHGAFHSRSQLLKVQRLGPKAFEQAAGFLRIREANNPLDASAVHPESYRVVEKMAADMEVNVKQLIESESLRKKIKLENYIDDRIGIPTLKDILNELAKPGRDPREQFETFSFDERVHDMEDLFEGMILPGIVTNITDFGAFVDVGVHQDGLVHLSQLANKFVKHPSEVVKVHQKVQVKVLSVDIGRRRIGLSMKTEEATPLESDYIRVKKQKKKRR